LQQVRRPRSRVATFEFRSLEIESRMIPTMTARGVARSRRMRRGSESVGTDSRVLRLGWAVNAPLDASGANFFLWFGSARAAAVRCVSDAREKNYFRVRTSAEQKLR